MEMEPQEFHEALAALAWQAELGADEAISEAPVNRYEEKVKAKAEKAASTQSPPITPSIAADPSVASSNIAAACKDLDALQNAINNFEDCALKRGARNTVFADGNSAAKVMIIGEAPGRDEDIAGQPFVERPGQLLDKMLAAIGLSRNAENMEEAVYITTALPWRPPQDREPSAQEMAMMKPFLLRHITLVKPEVLLLVGDLSNQMLLETDQGVSRLRGTWHEVAGIPALPIFHPRYLLRTAAKKREAWADLLTLKAKLNEG